MTNVLVSEMWSPWPEPMLTKGQPNHGEQISREFESKCENKSQNVSKNVGDFVQPGL